MVIPLRIILEPYQLPIYIYFCQRHANLLIQDKPWPTLFLFTSLSDCLGFLPRRKQHHEPRTLQGTYAILRRIVRMQKQSMIRIIPAQDINMVLLFLTPRFVAFKTPVLTPINNVYLNDSAIRSTSIPKTL